MGVIRKYSILIIGVSTLTLILWDVYAYFSEENSTFSVIMTDWSEYTPWIPFVWGFLMGHWFAPAKGSKD